MRRLKQDWNEHGWKRNPTYDYDFSGGNVVCVLAERTTLCDCFDLTHREAYRFKDTPNRNSFRRKDWDLYRNGRASHLPIQELRASQPEVASFGSRKRRRSAVHRKKLCCICGYLLRIVEVTRDDRYKFERGSCPDCKRRREERA